MEELIMLDMWTYWRLWDGGT